LVNILGLSGGPISKIYKLFVDENRLYSLTVGDEIWIWDKNSLSMVAFLSGTIKWSRVYIDNKYIIAARRNIINLWNKNTYKLEGTLKGHTHNVSGIYSDEKYIYSSSYDRTIRIWDKFRMREAGIIKSDETILRLIVDDKYIYGIIKDPSMNDYVVVDNVIKIWDKNDHRELGTLEINDCRGLCDLHATDTNFYANSNFHIHMWEKTPFPKSKTIKIADDTSIDSIYSDDKYIYAGTECYNTLETHVVVIDKASLKEVNNMRKNV